MWAVIPVKRPDAAKQRLAGLLSPMARAALVAAMLEDVLEALAGCASIARRSIVRSDLAFSDLERRYDVEAIVEPRNGLRRALRSAARHLRRAGADSMLIVPGDVPTVTAAELHTVTDDHTQMTIVSDSDGNGTNALAVTPPDLIPFLYGEGSYSAHVAAAAARGISARTLRLPGLELDIDTPADLHELIQRGSGTRAGMLAAELMRGIPNEHARPNGTIGAL